MGAVAKALTWITVERYSFDAMIKTGSSLEATSRIPGEWRERAVSGPLYELGFKGAGADDMGLSLELRLLHERYVGARRSHDLSLSLS